MSSTKLLLFYLSGLLSCLFLSGTLLASSVGVPATFDSDHGVIPRYVNRNDRLKPVVAIIAENRYTELTDYLIPFGIMVESQVADVYALGMTEDPINFFPASMLVQPQDSVAGFDVRYPLGADYVIVPAVHFDKDPSLLEWVKAQAEKGATIIGVCDGVWVLANAGLLEGKKSVAHWYSFKKLEKKLASTQWVKDTRFIADRNIVTTTGVTASIPVSIALVEAIAGRKRAAAVARKMGIESWSNEHPSTHFKLKTRHIMRAAWNWLSFWKHESIGIEVADGVDEIALALIADSYSRTYLSKAFPYSSNKSSVISKRGLKIFIDNERSVDRVVKLPLAVPPVSLLDYNLRQIEERYGRGTSEFVALQLEYKMDD